MHTLSVARALLGLFALLAFCAPAIAQTKAGAIKAVKVSGQVTRTSADGTESAVTESQTLKETDIIRTADNASVVLVFSNGASVRLGETTRLAIVEFKMDPLAEDISVAALEREPSVSRTRLHLDYGEMVGNVKTLNTASSYDVRTPVGAAGIRGTTFRILLRFDAQGRVNFTLSTLEGRVVFTGSIPTSGGEVTQTGAEQEISVPTGNEVVAVATVNPGTSTVSSLQISNVQSMSAATQQAITTVVNNVIEQARQSTNFSQAEQQSSAQSTPPPQQTQATPTNTPTTPTTTPHTPLQPQDRSGDRG